MNRLINTHIFFILLILVSTVSASESTVHGDEIASDKPDYSPFVDLHYPQNLYWGDDPLNPHHRS
jgi:hypothetical protein